MWVYTIPITLHSRTICFLMCETYNWNYNWMHLYCLLCTETIIAIFLINAKHIFFLLNVSAMPWSSFKITQHPNSHKWMNINYFHLRNSCKFRFEMSAWIRAFHFLIITVSWQPSRKQFCCLLLLVSSLRICKGQESLNIKIWQKDLDTAVTSHMYEGQKWLALSRRLIAEHMSSKFKRRGYLEHAALVCDAFCDWNTSYHSYTECIDQPLWTYNNWWL